MSTVTESFSPELRLVVEGARLRPADAALKGLKELAERELDWKHVGELGRYHQVLPVLLYHLHQLGVAIPETVAAGFKAYGRGVALQNMLLIEQLKGVHRLLAEADLPVIHFKGPVLTLQAYGNLGLRVCSDLDLLIKPEHLARVGSVFTGNDFMPGSKLQRWYGLRRRFFLYLSQQATFVHRTNNIHLDVHIGVAPPLYAYPTEFETLYERGVDVNVAGEVVRSFGAVDTLILLCLHGEKNRWEYLKYVSDIAAVLTTHTDLDWDEVYRRAEATHTYRIVQLGLTIAYTLLEAPLPAKVAEQIQSDPVIQELSQAIIGRLSSMNLQIASFEKRFWLHLHAQDTLLDRLRYLSVAALRWGWDKQTA